MKENEWEMEGRLGGRGEEEVRVPGVKSKAPPVPPPASVRPSHALARTTGSVANRGHAGDANADN